MAKLGQDKLTDTRAQAQNALLARGIGRILEPAAAVIVGPEQAVGADMLVWRELGKGALELLLREVQGVVVDVLGGVLESLQQEVNLSEVARQTDTVSGDLGTGVDIEVFLTHCRAR